MKKSPLLKYIIWSSAAFLVFVCFIKHDNLIRWIYAEFTIHRQHRQIEYYQKEIESLDERINAMSTDRDTMEKYARETFLFAEPGEDVYLIDE